MRKDWSRQRGEEGGVGVLRGKVESGWGEESVVRVGSASRVLPSPKRVNCGRDGETVQPDPTCYCALYAFLN